jgi:hypothetical protein
LHHKDLMQSIHILCAIIMLAVSASAFRALRTSTPALVPRRMITITNGVEFDTIAREWRLKWNTDNDKASLAEVQKVLNKYTDAIKKVDGVKGVQRIVCGGCQDYKVITSLPADKWGAWVRPSFNSSVYRFKVKLNHVNLIPYIRRRRSSLRRRTSSPR